MGIAEKKIDNFLKTCKTVDDWKGAYNIIIGELRDEIEAEKGLENYIVVSLGKEALDKFLYNVEEPLLNSSLIDTYRVSFDSSVNDIDLYRCNFLYISHLYKMVESRGNKLQRNIESLLGSEAYERLCFCGEYDREVEFHKRMEKVAGSEEKRFRLLVDYLTGKENNYGK